ncbi:MAG: HAMP domain-containing histidine kinase [Oscillospiraceae bacterium]|nr:HAMP domain-containing histidine kinase [Oscillospiraceae bacterium]
MKPEERKQRLSLTLLFSAVFLVFFFLTGVIITAVILLLVHLDVLVLGSSVLQTDLIVGVIVLSSVVLGTLLTGLLSHIPLGPVNKIINAMNALAAGDFHTRLQFSGRLARNPTARELTRSFNTMASELEHTEMLRSDFINNFSHEFKTPIVSIAGFAKLLKRGNLTPEEQREYLDIIERESLRLSAMATNVLSMTKVENQTILTDVTRYDLSEQIRSCVLLLEPKWSKKRIEWDVEPEEFFVSGSRALLEEVWLNLIDNAVKFSPEGALVTVSIARTGRALAVRFTNRGPQIPAEDRDAIFRKFYQADGSHATEGNGIGLAVVRRIAQLHGGSVTAESDGEATTFTVTLPDRPAAGQG